MPSYFIVRKRTCFDKIELDPWSNKENRPYEQGVRVLVLTHTTRTMLITAVGHIYIRP